VFALIGHTYPVFYRFKGGKGFLVTFALLWVLDWRAGLVATAVMLTVLPLSGFMSLSSILTLIAGSVTLIFVRTPMPALFLTFGAVLLVIWRHRSNIARLVAGTEKKFSFRKKKAPAETPTDLPAAERATDGAEEPIEVTAGKEKK
ncbi:MAG: glycerol-3-phosphate acyltransferase, partial [Clostridia bacterium]|nr:glycerol-3-phosphate acyltransferase [Clostridia bacterium]